jgi:hypothetical protein
MGMQSASVQQSPNQGSGKGMGPAAGFPAQQTQQVDDMVSDVSNPNPSMTAPAVMPSQQPMGKGGNRNYTMPGQGRQPRMGMPNAYSNTIQPWDNARIQPQSQSGKGKG